MPDLKIKLHNQEYPVEISGDGLFHATIGDQRIHAASYAELVRIAKKTKVKIAVQFTQESGNCMVRHGTVTSNLLVHWEDGKTEQLTRYASQLMPQLTADETLVLTSLLRQQREIAERLGTFRKSHTFGTGGINEAVREAQRKAVEKEGK